MNKKILVPLLVMGMTTVRAFAMNPVTIVDQGSFMAGGKVITAPGSYIDNEPVNFDGETLHGDAAYVFYQIPKEAKHNGIVFNPANPGNLRRMAATDFKIFFLKKDGKHISWMNLAAVAAAILRCLPI